MPKFLEDKLRQEYGDNPHAIFGTMNKIGAMRGSKTTPKGMAMEAKHNAKIKPMFTGGVVRPPYYDPNDPEQQFPGMPPPPMPTEAMDPTAEMAPPPMPTALSRFDAQPDDEAGSGPPPAPSPAEQAPPPMPTEEDRQAISNLEKGKHFGIEGIGRDPRYRNLAIQQKETQDQVPPPMPGLRNQGTAQQQAIDYAQKILMDPKHPGQFKQPSVLQNVLGAIAPRFNMHPNLTRQYQNYELLKSRADEERKMQQAQSQEEIKRDTLATNAEARQLSAAQRQAALKPPSPGTIKRNVNEELLIPDSSDPTGYRTVRKGEPKETPDKLAQSFDAEALNVIRNTDLTPEQKTAKINELATTFSTLHPKNEPTGKEDPNHWIAIVNDPTASPEDKRIANANIATWEKTQKNQRPPITINANWTPQQANAAQNGKPGERNEAFLQTLSPADQVIVKMIADYDYPLPKGRGALDKNAKYIAGAKAYDPNFSAPDYDNRASLKKSFMSGKSADNLTALNTALVHLGGLDQAASQLNNSTFQRYNAFANWLVNETGNPQTKPFQNYRTAFNEEMARALKGGVATEDEVGQWNHNIDMADSPAKLRASVQTVAHIIAGRIGQQEETYARGIGKPPARPFVSPQAKAVLDKMGAGGEAGADSGRRQQKSPSTGQFRHSFDGGKTWQPGPLPQ